MGSSFELSAGHPVVEYKRRHSGVRMSRDESNNVANDVRAYLSGGRWERGSYCLRLWRSQRAAFARQAVVSASIARIREKTGPSRSWRKTLRHTHRDRPGKGL